MSENKIQLDPSTGETTQASSKQPAPPSEKKRRVDALCGACITVEKALADQPDLLKQLSGEKLDAPERKGVPHEFPTEYVRIAESFFSEEKDARKAGKAEIIAKAKSILVAGVSELATIEAGATPEKPLGDDEQPEPYQEPQPDNEAKDKQGDEDNAANAQTNADVDMDVVNDAEAVAGAPATVPQNQVQMIQIDHINLDARTESRRLDETVVADYIDVLKEAKSSFPPITVFHDGKTYFLADGFHRVNASKQAEIVAIKAEVFQGGRMDALKFSLGSNQDHGQRRTTADKKYSVAKAFKEFGDRSDRFIAELCGVSPTFVGNCRKETKIASGVHADTSLEGGGEQPKMRLSKDNKRHPASKKGAKGTDTPKPLSDDPSPLPSEPGDEDGVEDANDKSNNKAVESSRVQGAPTQPDTTFELETEWSSIRDYLVHEFERWPETYRVVFIGNLESLVSRLKE